MRYQENNFSAATQRGTPNSELRTPNSSGFTMLELVIVMTIIVILAAVGVANYQRIQVHARETVMKQDLKDMRKAIDEYAADKEELPQALEDLEKAGYIREIPIDPITGERDWQVETGEDTVSRKGGTGVVDVFSNASGEDSSGTPYSKY